VYLSVLDLYTIGIGPSSSHTVGPMRAAARFAREVEPLAPARVRVELFGSLGLTGKGHGTDRAVVSGLTGSEPETVDPDSLPAVFAEVESTRSLRLPGGHLVAMDLSRDLIFNRRNSLPHHSNGLCFSAIGKNGETLREVKCYSVGGGFIVDEREIGEPRPAITVAYPFTSGVELVGLADDIGLPVCGLVMDNEKAWRPRRETTTQLDAIWEAMQGCVQAGLNKEGQLPGGLRVERRAPALYRKLCERPESALRDSLTILDWVDVYAIAVNEENASGGRVVTAPTNGAAGIIPAVMHYCDRFLGPRSPDWHRNFLLTAGAIGMLFKENASISGADVGCQGEVGVACSMAAGALAELMGGTPSQVENAAEIGMEHNLGLTCDPIGGLVQIPCIERNAMGAVKAINAARIALRGDGRHKVSLDAVIRTMRETGKDMRRKYKETSRGGLAVNVVEC
jgi:L-serine dehydratase